MQSMPRVLCWRHKSQASFLPTKPAACPSPKLGETLDFFSSPSLLKIQPIAQQHQHHLATGWKWKKKKNPQAMQKKILVWFNGLRKQLGVWHSYQSAWVQIFILTSETNFLLMGTLGSSGDDWLKFGNLTHTKETWIEFPAPGLRLRSPTADESIWKWTSKWEISLSLSLPLK